MKRLLLLLLVSLIATFILILIYNPQLLDQIWLWCIGLAGSIIGLFRNLVDLFQQWFRHRDKDQHRQPSHITRDDSPSATNNQSNSQK